MTEPKSEKISASLMRALRAVGRDEVSRKLNGNRRCKMCGPTGIGELTIWRLVWAKLIEDGPRIGDTYVQVLTTAGKNALATGLFQP